MGTTRGSDGTRQDDIRWYSAVAFGPLPSPLQRAGPRSAYRAHHVRFQGRRRDVAGAALHHTDHRPQLVRRHGARPPRPAERTPTGCYAPSWRPPSHIRGAGTSKRVHRIRPATLAELEVLVAEMPQRYRLMVLLASWCGLRFGELAELRRKDVDVKNGVLHVRRGVVRVTGGRVIDTPKSDAGTRDVAIPPHLMPVVKEHLSTTITGGRTGCCSRPRTARATSHRPRSTGRHRRGSAPDTGSTALVGRPDGRTYGSTTYGTPAPCSRLRRAPRWPS